MYIYSHHFIPESISDCEINTSNSFHHYNPSKPVDEFLNKGPDRTSVLKTIFFLPFAWNNNSLRMAGNGQFLGNVKIIHLHAKFVCT